MKALRTKSGFFVRSHVAAYFVSLLFADLLQGQYGHFLSIFENKTAHIYSQIAIGSIMNTKWVRKMSVDLNGFCTAQGVLSGAAYEVVS